MRSRTGRIAGLVLAVGWVAAQAVHAEPSPSKGGRFPGAGIDLMTHELTVGIYRVGDDGSRQALLETLKFQGRMLGERGDPYVNADGYRQIDFLVRKWEAVAWSQTLNTLITYSLNDGPQRMSKIVAQQTGSDYPARFQFNVNFGATAFDSIIDPEHEGMPQGDGF